MDVFLKLSSGLLVEVFFVSVSWVVCLVVTSTVRILKLVCKESNIS